MSEVAENCMRPWGSTNVYCIIDNKPAPLRPPVSWVLWPEQKALSPYLPVSPFFFLPVLPNHTVPFLFFPPFCFWCFKRILTSLQVSKSPLSSCFLSHERPLRCVFPLSEWGQRRRVQQNLTYMQCTFSGKLSGQLKEFLRNSAELIKRFIIIKLTPHPALYLQLHCFYSVMIYSFLGIIPERFICFVLRLNNWYITSLLKKVTASARCHYVWLVGCCGFITLRASFRKIPNMWKVEISCEWCLVSIKLINLNKHDSRPPQWDSSWLHKWRPANTGIW